MENNPKQNNPKQKETPKSSWEITILGELFYSPLEKSSKAKRDAAHQFQGVHPDTPFSIASIMSFAHMRSLGLRKTKYRV